MTPSIVHRLLARPPSIRFPFPMCNCRLVRSFGGTASKTSLPSAGMAIPVFSVVLYGSIGIITLRLRLITLNSGRGVTRTISYKLLPGLLPLFGAFRFPRWTCRLPLMFVGTPIPSAPGTLRLTTLKVPQIGRPQSTACPRLASALLRNIVILTLTLRLCAVGCRWSRWVRRLKTDEKTLLKLLVPKSRLLSRRNRWPNRGLP